MDSAVTDATSPDKATASGSDTASWLGWVSRQGAMGSRVASFGWGSTSLGAIGTWSAVLRDAVTICLGSLLPMSVQWGPDLTIIYNDACRDLYGEGRFASALGRPTLEVWPETADHVRANVLATLRDGTPYFGVDDLMPLNRAVPLEECYVTTSAAPIIEDGRPVGVFSAFMETTAEVLAARRLRTLADLGRDHRELSSELEVARSVMRILSASNPGDHIAGGLYAAGDAPHPSPLATFGDAEPSPRQVALVAECGANGAARIDFGTDGSAWHAHAMRDPETGGVTHVLLLLQPPSRPADDSLRTYYALVALAIGAALMNHGEHVAQRHRVLQMAALDAAKSAFFAGVSHELRTPLALISAPVQDILERDPGLSDATRKALGLVQSNVSRLTRMVEAMLDFSRMEAGRLVPHVEQADVAAQTRALAADFAPAFARSGLDLVVDVPDLSRRPLLDLDFLERIVSNLLSNALKYTPTGQVGIRLVEEHDHYAIVVTDTGIGVALEDLDRIFERFERLPAQPGARSTAGAGIGLAMVRQLTRLLDGEVTVESVVGRGTTFTVRLPFEPSRPLGVTGQSVTPRRVNSFLAEIDTWIEPDLPPVVRPKAASARLLIAEDDVQLAAFLRDCLSDDYEVQLVRHGAAALEALRGGEFDLVLTDLAMPGMDGLELVRQIRADATLRELPVVMLSASGDASASGLAVGADDFVTKPFTVTDLQDRLAANLARARERSADAAWRRAVMFALRDPMVIFDREGRVVEMNEAFTDLFGYGMADGPFSPPYPWWPSADEDPEALEAIRGMLEDVLRNEDVEADTVLYTSDRRRIWVHTSGTSVEQPRTGLSARIRVLRDITRDKQARDRRAAAARVSADFASTDDLTTLLGVAEYGFELLFDGGSTIQVMVDRPYVFVAGKDVGPQDLHDEVSVGLASEPNVDTLSVRTGILLAPQTSATGARAWVQFPRPRRISLDELIAADLLAQAFALAVDRVVALQESADKQANLEQAVDSHRLIGQAVGILVERHRLTTGQAFDRLKQASQRRNVKLREVAQRVIETGVDPENV